MGRLLLSICVAALAAALWGLALPARAEGDATCHVKGTRVNLRSAPDGDVLQQLAGGETLQLLGRDGEWCHVAIAGSDVSGWVHRDYVTAADATAGTQLAASAGDAPAPTSAGNQIGQLPLTDFTDGTDAIIVGQCVDPKSGSEAKPAPTAPKPPEAAKLKPAAKKAPDTKKVAANFKSVSLTSPGKLGSADYRSVAGPELASISAENVNLRESPALTAKVVGNVAAGDRAYVITNRDPWYLVSLPDKKLKGWIFGEYVDVQPRVEIKAEDVRLRESPSLDARVKDQLAKGDVFYKVSAKDGWVQVASSASGMSGWVKAEYVKRSEGSVSRKYTVSGDQVNFRASPAVDADIIGKLPAGVTVNVLGRNDKWAYAYFEGHKGWLYTEYLTVGATRASPESGIAGDARVAPTKTLTWKQVGGHPIGNRLIERARAMMGTPYVWGGESDDGVDCSGLIYKLLCDEGCDVKCLPRRASEQMAQLGLAVDKEDLEPGDLVFFHTYKEGASHVGIYLGDGDFIHASSAQHQVTVSNLSERYYRERFVGARRLTEEEIKTLQ